MSYAATTLYFYMFFVDGIFHDKCPFLVTVMGMVGVCVNFLFV